MAKINFKKIPIGTELRRKKVGYTFKTKKEKVSYAKCYALDKNIEGDNFHFIAINFTQDKPFTKLKITNSIFESCNLVNVEVDESNEIIDCNVAQREIEKKDGKEITTFYDKKTKEIINVIEEIIEE